MKLKDILPEVRKRHIAALQQQIQALEIKSRLGVLEVSRLEQLKQEYSQNVAILKLMGISAPGNENVT